jgi:hypothetical protein
MRVMRVPSLPEYVGPLHINPSPLYPSFISYTYVLQLFYVREQSGTGLHFRPALLLQQTGYPINQTDTIVFESRESLLAWDIDSKLLTFDQLMNLDKEFRSANAAQFGLTISIAEAVTLIPRFSPQPGNVVPSPEFQQKMEATSSSAFESAL